VLDTGRRLGGFEVVALLGAGGMGEVYQARDARLGRDVALKILPEPLRGNAQWLARFESEARILASLSAPGIAAIHGLEESEGIRFLVLELIPGETLGERLKRGPLPVRDALEACRQIALALEAAHERGIVHRDLKCANVKLTPGGAVKLLDFGIAKALPGDDTLSDPEGVTSPHDITEDGDVVGTAAYMSPEQTRGQPVDTRTDIWSFGCVLYETLTGTPAFGRKTRSDTLVAVLKGEPDWRALPRETPRAARRLLRRCLQHDKSRRLQHIADARLELEEALLEPAAGWLRTLGARLAGFPLRSWAALVALAAAGVVVGVASTRQAPLATRSGRPQARLQIKLPSSLHFSDLVAGKTTLALSPDGRRLVFAAGPTGGRRLYSRPIEALEVRPIPGTEGGDNPFFSPDGEWIGFDVDGKLKKVRVEGGQPLELCRVEGLRGASWGPDGTIVFAASAYSGLWTVSAGGGTPRALTTLVQNIESSHRYPRLLPGGKAALFSIMTPNMREEERRIAVVSLETGRSRTLFQGGSCPIYLDSGHLLYGRGGSLIAVRFDLRRLEVVGEHVPVMEDVLMWAKTAGAVYADVSANGTLVFVPDVWSRNANSTLAWIDRRGQVTPIALPAGPYAEPALSPDGQRVALTLRGPTDDIYVFDLERHTRSRLTLEGDNGSPVWSPDGRYVAFWSTRNGPRNVFRVASDGSGSTEQLTRSANNENMVSYAPDGAAVFFTEQTADTASDLWTLPLEGDRQPRPLLATPAIELFPALSPDGHWLAYTSTESQSDEVYVRPYQGPGRKYTVSHAGGSQPVWSKSGRELFYRSGNTVMAVDVATGPRFASSAPKALFTSPSDLGGVEATYDVAPDARRFLVLVDEDRDAVLPQIVLVPDWFQELRAKLP
jgi:Tol biopolymer transport system component